MVEQMKHTIARDELANYLARTLDITRFRDYCPNGMQVEGRDRIGTLVTGVTASKALVDAAIHAKGDAITAGATAYLSGEISEPTVHLAREAGVAYLACGHHATERYGVQAVGDHLAAQFGIRHVFVDIGNPV